MVFTLGDLLALADRSILNPWLSAPVAIALGLRSGFTTFPATRDQLVQGLLAIGKGTTRPRILTHAIRILAVGLVLRINRYLSSKALNNGVSAPFDWEKEIIVVTGGAGGIGASAARQLASRGSHVVVLDVLPLSYTAPETLHYYKCDLSNYDELQSVAAVIRQEIGEPTCVVANAGLCRGKPLLEASQRDIELTFAVNSLGLIWTAKTFLPAMAERNHGHFLIMASQTGHLATAGVADYAATKAAAISIYEGIQTELKHVHRAPAVRVSCISPSAVNTKMFAGIRSPSNFVMPRLEPRDVGAVIAGVLWSGRAQNVLTPAFAYISPPTRALPDWWRVGLQDGGKDVMAELRPHRPL